MAGGHLLSLAGDKLNAVSRARSVTSSASLNSRFPLTQIYNGDPGEPARWSSAVVADVIVDLNEILVDDFETGSNGDAISAVAPSWTVTGTPTISTLQANLGTRSCRLNGAGYAISQNKDLLSGAPYRIAVALYGDGTNPTEALFQNRKSQKYLTSTGTWQAGLVAWATKTTTGWATTTVDFTVDSYSEAMEFLISHALTIRHQTGTLDNFVDTVDLHQRIDFLSLHNHNLVPSLVCDWQSKATAAASYASQLILTKSRPSFWGRLGAVSTDRFHKIAFTGGPPIDPIQIGELVLGTARQLERGPNLDWRTKWAQPQDRVMLERIGKVITRNLTADEARSLNMDFTSATDSQRREVRDEIERRSGSGQYNVIVVPDADEPKVVLGRVEQVWEQSRPFTNVWRYGLTVAEQPGPVTIL